MTAHAEDWQIAERPDGQKFAVVAHPDGTITHYTSFGVFGPMGDFGTLKSDIVLRPARNRAERKMIWDRAALVAMSLDRQMAMFNVMKFNRDLETVPE